ncbi:MAG: TetR family transcriptional regulator [Hydrogenophaga sp.]|nr:TetR family transcriptional regulator [Hydrogenophaga sp.]
MHMKETDHKKPQRLSREERRIQTRVALREAALREFALCGVSGTSAERIAEAAGFTRGAFYSNFENKQSLLLDLISERIQSEQASWIELANSQLDLDTLLTTLEARTEGFDPNGLWSLIASETYLYALRDPAFAADYRAYHEASRNTFVRIVESLLRRAGKAAPMDIDEFCDAMLTLSRSVRLPSADQPNEAPRPFARHLLMTLVRGMLAIAPPAR